MTKKRVIKKIAYSLISLIILGLAIIYIWSTIILNKTYHIPLADVTIPNDTVSINEGHRLVQIAHCSDCHGEHFTGTVFDKVNNVAEFVAPNITKIIPSYSNAELERLIRHGIKKNGHSVLIMPSFMYYQLKEESVEKMIAYLRTLHPQTDTLNGASTSFALLGRLALIQRKLIPVADMIDHNSPRKYIHYDTTQVAFGRYLAMTTCTACHGEDLKGEAGFGPDLVIAASYKKEDFCKLLHTGIALGGRNLDLMSHVAKNNLCHLTDNEMNCIYAYLKTKPTQ